MGFPVPTYSFKKHYLGHAEDIHAVFGHIINTGFTLKRNACFCRISNVKITIFLKNLKIKHFHTRIMGNRLGIRILFQSSYFHYNISFIYNDQWCIYSDGKLLRIMIMIHLSISMHCFSKQGWKTLSLPSRPAIHWSINLSYIYFFLPKHYHQRNNYTGC